MSRLVGVASLLALCMSGVFAINTYVGDDGRSRYQTALQCDYQSLYFAFYYNVDRSTFTTRTDDDCCYLADTRNKCCLQTTVLSDGTQNTECRCDLSIDCGAQPRIASTTSPTTTSTNAPTTTTTNAPTTTTTSEPTTTTTNAPTTSTTEPTTTTTAAATTTEPTTTTTTTPSTTTETTTAPFRSLCSESRVLNGELVNDSCVFSGIAVIGETGTDRATCNAVYTTALVNGVLKQTFMTLTFCTNAVALLLENNNKMFDLAIGKQKYPILEPLISIVDGDNGDSFLIVNPPYSNVLSDLGCQASSCPFNNATMGNNVDFNDCKMVSYGSSNTALQQDGLREAAVKLYPEGCDDIDDLFGTNNTMCFKSVSDSNLFCSNDGGAPVYCRATSNSELILIGVVSFQTACDSRPTIKVIPVPI